MIEDRSAKFSREQLYNEIWAISVSGVSKKYDVPYAELLKLCKENDIPIPPSGYWIQLKFGKPVTKTPLPDSSIIEVTLPTNSTPKRSRRTAASVAATKGMADTQQEESSGFVVKAAEEKEISEKQPVVEIPDISKDNQLTYRTVDGENIYNREKLYEEVWAKPVVDVAVQYGVSDVAIHKICKSLNVPVPPRGYWAKLRAGEKLNKPPLPATNGVTEKIGAKTFEGVRLSKSSSQPLAFLTESERQKVLLAAQQIKMPPENAHLHKKIAAYRSVVKEWNKKDTKPEGAKRSFKNYSNRPPFLAGVISSESLPRVYRILDALFRQVESLGGSVNDDLSLQIRNELVRLEVFEAQDEVKHVITKQEAREIITYEDAKRHHTWAAEPNIRKHDYVFNGKLRISIRQNRYFRETDNINIESRLSDILIALYEESEAVRIEREAREEAARKKEEEARLREERRNRYNVDSQINSETILTEN
ncbi:hypothetical protein [Pelotomaculum sp. PtaB.Bin117]|uniref:hypothetical protein n=1 Tax=Pelotomaculum sp. PtaB.Bin117 TaxID=1811694 RepID=UPI0009C668C2|nr:hypothetical protein [Pelotomaculum sp. PtaB.Bin117]OPX85747.1 MAG: hypothetical protein A4E54_02239 [Pelotomaculum sp. PtaB.Bin117]